MWHLIKVYWYTVEFGLVREAGGQTKAFGAGERGEGGRIGSRGRRPDEGFLDLAQAVPLMTLLCRGSPTASGRWGPPCLAFSPTRPLLLPAGILSSFGELQSMGEGRAELLQLDPFSPLPKMSYKDGFQKRSGMQKCNDHGSITELRRGPPEDNSAAVTPSTPPRCNALHVIPLWPSPLP